MDWIMFFTDPVSIATVVSAIIAIAALFLTFFQIRLSNKHQLFEKRLNNYKLFKCLLEIYTHNRDNILDNEDFYERPEKYFPWLTNSANLEEMSLLFREPLNTEHLLLFMHKCDELEEAHIESALIWGKDNGELVSNFMKRYLFLLRHIFRRYCFLIDHPDKHKAIGWQNASRNSLNRSLKELDKAYQLIVDKEIDKKLLHKMKLGLGKTNDEIKLYH